jgi:hypothetical protein
VNDFTNDFRFQLPENLRSRMMDCDDFYLRVCLPMMIKRGKEEFLHEIPHELLKELNRAEILCSF